MTWDNDHLELGEHLQNWEDEMSWDTHDADDVDDEEKDEDKEVVRLLKKQIIRMGWYQNFQTT